MGYPHTQFSCTRRLARACRHLDRHLADHILRRHVRPQLNDLASHPPILSCTNNILGIQVGCLCQKLKDICFAIGNREQTNLAWGHRHTFVQC